MEKIRVMIIDDQYVPRQMFNMSIENSEKYEVVACINSAAFAQTYILKNNINLIIMDILMNDGSNGLVAAKKIKEINPNIKIIAVTSILEMSWIEKAKSIGIEGFWYKEISKENIISVMDRVMQGEIVYPKDSPKTPLGCISSIELTTRELDVLREMTTGASNSEIAEKLSIEESTVKTHIRHMLEKTQYKNRLQLAIEARIAGIVVSNNT